MSYAVLITGGAGYVGSHVARTLSLAGYTPIIIDSFLHHQTFNHAWATLYRGDYADEPLLERICVEHSVRAVVHCAALIEVGRSVQDPGIFYEYNVSKMITLLGVMARLGINTIIFSSSAAVYGNPIYTPIDEEHPTNPINPYGWTKLMGERLLADFYAAHGIRYIIFRYFNVAGAWPEERLGEQHEPETHIIPLILRAALEKKPFTMFGNEYGTKDGTAVRDYVHVRDIATAHVRALAHLESGHPPDIFNIGSGRGVSNKELVEVVEELCRVKLSVVYGPRRIGDPGMLVADVSKVREFLVWVAEKSIMNLLVKSTCIF